MMFASFHFNGTTPSSNDKLNTVASGILICSTISYSNLGDRINNIYIDEIQVDIVNHTTFLGIIKSIRINI